MPFNDTVPDVVIHKIKWKDDHMVLLPTNEDINLNKPNSFLSCKINKHS